MSRTYRRNKKDLIRLHIGGNDFYGQPYHPWKFRHLPLEEARIRAARRFTADNHSGQYHVCRWWRKLYYVDPERRGAKVEIRRCLDQGSFDDHLDPRLRGAASQWHWWMT